MAGRQKRPLETVSASALRRLSPAENVRAGYSAKAERYILKDAKVRKGMATVSKREFLKRQTAEREGLARPMSLERAAKARRRGEFGYSSEASAEQALKQRATRLRSVKDFKGRTYRPGLASQYAELRARKLAGETLDQHEWCAMMDVASAIDDPMIANLRSSANVTV